MPQPLTAQKREELFQQFVKDQTISIIARVCKTHRQTIEKYKKLDNWDNRLGAIVAAAAKKTDDTGVDTITRILNRYRGMQKWGLTGLFNEDGSIKPDAAKKATPRDFLKAIEIGLLGEREILGDSTGPTDKPIVIVVQDQRGVVQSLSTVPLVTDADFEGEDSE